MPKFQYYSENYYNRRNNQQNRSKNGSYIMIFRQGSRVHAPLKVFQPFT